MKHAIYSELSENAFSELGIGGEDRCVMILDTIQDAIDYAEVLIRNNVFPLPKKEEILNLRGALLNWFLGKLNSDETFVIAPVVEE